MIPHIKCMFDTRAFNLMVDDAIPVRSLASHVSVYATHIQIDEINNTKNPERRAVLAQMFKNVVSASIPTDSSVVGVSRVGAACVAAHGVVRTTSGVWDVSRWDQANFGEHESLYLALKADLDKVNKAKRNNVQDALIAETAIKGGYVLVTDDCDLVRVTTRYGGTCVSLESLLSA
jgi:hypothetical protein